jgi:hypothetical protein
LVKAVEVMFSVVVHPRYDSSGDEIGWNRSCALRLRWGEKRIMAKAIVVTVDAAVFIERSGFPGLVIEMSSRSTGQETATPGVKTCEPAWIATATLPPGAAAHVRRFQVQGNNSLMGLL